MLDLIGKRFERLKVVKFYKKDEHHVYWVCKCDCGKEKVVRNQHLISGKIRSCGCLAREIRSNRMKNNRGQNTMLICVCYLGQNTYL